MSESGSIGTYGTSLNGLLHGVEFSIGVTLSRNDWSYDGDGGYFFP